MSTQSEAERLAILMNDSIEDAIVAEGIKGTPIHWADVSIPWRDAMIAAAGQVLREDRHHLIRWMYSEAERLRVIPDGLADWQAVNRQKTANALIAVIAHLSVAEMLGPPQPVAIITVRGKRGGKTAESRALAEMVETALPPGAHPDSPGVREMFERGRRDAAALERARQARAQIQDGYTGPSAPVVEAAAKAIWDREREVYTHRCSWEALGETGRDFHRQNACAAIVAADAARSQHTIDCKPDAEGGCVGHV